eukprot:s3552_g3.t1
MLRRALSWACCCYAVSAQDAECQSIGTICCALKYDGARNFFNQHDLRCEAPADDCGPTQEYDAQAATTGRDCWAWCNPPKNDQHFEFVNDFVQ